MGTLTAKAAKKAEADASKAAEKTRVKIYNPLNRALDEFELMNPDKGTRDDPNPDRAQIKLGILKLAKKIADLGYMDKADLSTFVKETKSVYDQAIKDPKKASDALIAAREERDKTYAALGLKLEKNAKAPILIERNYQEALKEIENSYLPEEEKNNKIAELKGINDYWDGRATSDEELPQGSYFYHLVAKNNDGVEIIKNGIFLLLR